MVCGVNIIKLSQINCLELILVIALKSDNSKPLCSFVFKLLMSAKIVSLFNFKLEIFAYVFLKKTLLKFMFLPNLISSFSFL